LPITDRFPSVSLAHKPTPLEKLGNLSEETGVNIWIKRDDCTGLAFGGNKTRQLEYYIGQALKESADVLLTTGAVQSNHVRMTVAAARKLNLDVEVQLEHRVDTATEAYYQSGNAFLVHLMGASVHYFPVGDDESAADDAMYQRAEQLQKDGRKPYVIPLSNVHAPWGALGYVEAAGELLLQQQEYNLKVDCYVVASGSASTHAGLLAGLRAHGDRCSVRGICVRRDAVSQSERVWSKSMAVAQLLKCSDALSRQDVLCDDSALWPSYGVMSEAVRETLLRVARTEGILLDPVYTAKSFHGMLSQIESGEISAGETVVYIHTGGAPAVFAYPDLVNAEKFNLS